MERHAGQFESMTPPQADVDIGGPANGLASHSVDRVRRASKENFLTPCAI
jgi:hypothetical protein